MANTESERIQRLEATVSEIEVHVQSIQGYLMSTKDGDSDSQTVETNSSRQMRDTVWCCTNCGARLGVYNVEKDELRVRYKDFCVYITPGAGGKTMVPCRRCGEQNILQDTRQT